MELACCDFERFGNSSRQIAALGSATAEDYASFLPGRSFNRAGFADRAGLDLTIRGVSNTRLTDATAGTGALTTGFYINEVAAQGVNGSRIASVWVLAQNHNVLTLPRRECWPPMDCLARYRYRKAELIALRSRTRTGRKYLHTG
jgi:hypothetical protein